MSDTDIGPEDPAAAPAPTAAVAAPEPRGPASPSSAGPASPPAHGRATHPEPSRGARRWSDWLVIAVPAATALVVGGYEIGGPSLWRDEAYTKDAITRSASQIFALLEHQGPRTGEVGHQLFDRPEVGPDHPGDLLLLAVRDVEQRAEHDHRGRRGG